MRVVRSCEQFAVTKIFFLGVYFLRPSSQDHKQRIGLVSKYVLDGDVQWYVYIFAEVSNASIMEPNNGSSKLGK